MPAAALRPLVGGTTGSARHVGCFYERRRRRIVDLVYLGLTVGFFAVSWAMVELFDRL
jgi:hypothetical protein